MERALRHGLALIVLLTASLVDRSAEAQPIARPAPRGAATGNRVFSLPPLLPVEAPPPRSVPGEILRGITVLAEHQRLDGPELRYGAPFINDGADFDWMPDVRVILAPPGERVVARPWRWVGLRATPVTTTNYRVATGRGNDAMLLGFELTLPWMVP